MAKKALLISFLIGTAPWFLNLVLWGTKGSTDVSVLCNIIFVMLGVAGGLLNALLTFSFRVKQNSPREVKSLIVVLITLVVFGSTIAGKEGVEAQVLLFAIHMVAGIPLWRVVLLYLTNIPERETHWYLLTRTYINWLNIISSGIPMLVLMGIIIALRLDIGTGLWLAMAVGWFFASMFGMFFSDTIHRDVEVVWWRQTSPLAWLSLLAIHLCSAYVVIMLTLWVFSWQWREFTVMIPLLLILIGVPIVHTVLYFLLEILKLIYWELWGRKASARRVNRMYAQK